MSSCSSRIRGCDSFRLFLIPLCTDALTDVEVEISLSGSKRLNMVDSSCCFRFLLRMCVQLLVACCYAC